MKDPKDLLSSRQLLVEGQDDKCFFDSLLRYMGVSDIQIQDIGGKNELSRFLKAFVVSSGFKDKVTSIGIIRDADNDASSAFKSVCSSLKSAKLPVPKKPVKPTRASKTNPKVSVFVLPDNSDKGMLETLCLSAVNDDPAMKCVEEYFGCLKNEGLKVKNLHKAKLQTFLASRKTTDSRLGIAAEKGYLKLEDPAYKQVVKYLRLL